MEIIQDGRSRIDISCRVDVAEGMEILTSSPAVQKQQQITLEFLLSNHPLDCPVCDDAGECDLQNFYISYGPQDSRMREVKRRKSKAVDIGLSIMLDSERCVLCSRCARFTAEITKTHELGIFGMGSTEELNVYPGKRLDNEYAGNVVDLCPVGALTDKDFRFKRRVWYLRSAPSVCQLCARGCNVRIDYDVNPFHEQKSGFQMRTHRTEPTACQRIQRIKPRVNLDVNAYWICDHGRYGYKPTDAADRLLTPMVKLEGRLQPVSQSEAVKQMAAGILAGMKGGGQKVAVIVSPQLTTEEIYAAWTLFIHKLGLLSVDHRLPIPEDWRGDDLLKSPDPFPNRTACEWLGVTPGLNGVRLTNLSEAIQAGKVDTLVAIGAHPQEFFSEETLRKIKRCYGILRNLPEDQLMLYDAVLPASGWGEYRGSFINFQGRIQRLEAALEPLGQAQPVWKLLSELSAALKKPLGWTNPDDAWRSLNDRLPYLRGITLEAIGSEGLILTLDQFKATA
ncbi:MAG: molybdopterin-dependent oxidoreductase [Calditrichota bacterium]